MTFTDWTATLGNLGEFVGAIAVVATLVYVARQMRHTAEQLQQNARALQVSAYQDLIGRIADINRASYLSPDWSDLVQRAVERPDSLAPGELARYNVYLTTLTRHADMAFFQYERGALSHARYRSALGPFFGILVNSQLAREQCRRVIRSEVFLPEFREELGRLLEEVDRLEPGQVGWIRSHYIGTPEGSAPGSASRQASPRTAKPPEP